MPSEPMTREREDELVAMVKAGNWHRLREEWSCAKAPFGILSADFQGGCPSIVVFDEDSSPALSPEERQRLLLDDDIVNMGGLDEREEKWLKRRPRTVFRTFERYQKMARRNLEKARVEEDQEG